MHTLQTTERMMTLQQKFPSLFVHIPDEATVILEKATELFMVGELFACIQTLKKAYIMGDDKFKFKIKYAVLVINMSLTKTIQITY